MDSSSDQTTNNATGTTELSFSYTYFVAYMCQGRIPNSVMHANNSITRPMPITSYEDIVEIQNALLAANSDATAVVILNYQLLLKEEGFPPKQQWRSGFEPVLDSLGPFSVVADDGTQFYSRIPTFNKACVLAEADAVHGDGEACFVLDSKGRRVAGFIRPDECCVVVEADLDEAPEGISNISTYMQENLQNTWKFQTRRELVAHLVEEARHAVARPDCETMMGLREFKINEDHRMLDMDPPYQMIFQKFDGKFSLGDNLPEDIRIALQRFVA